MRTAASGAAAEKLADAAHSLGLEFSSAPPDQGIDGYLALPGNKPMPVHLKQASLVSAHGLADRLADWGRQAPPGVIRLILADRITGDARKVLREAGWGWLDMRGHLRLVGQGLLVDTDVPASSERTRKANPFAGSVGIEVAVAILLDPHRRIGIRHIANHIGRAPSSVSEAVAAMRAAGLVSAEGKPRTPDLFWELAATWRPQKLDVATVPHNDVAVLQALRVNIDDFDKAGWALGDTRAAAVYGAPVAIRSDHPYEFYVPDRQVLRRAGQLLGPAHNHDERAATLLVAPTPDICAHRKNPDGYANTNSEHWPLAQPLFVALDLARDPGRGREILNDWTPPEPWYRVW